MFKKLFSKTPKEYKIIMSTFSDNIETAIAAITITNGVAIADVNAAINTALTPVLASITQNTTDISDLQTAVTNLVAKLPTTPVAPVTPA